MNQYIENQISNMVTMAKTFEQACKMSALKNDGIIEKDEQRQLAKINKVTERFISDLKKIKQF